MTDSDTPKAVYNDKDIAKAVGISLSRVHFIWKRILKEQKISAR